MTWSAAKDSRWSSSAGWASPRAWPAGRSGVKWGRRARAGVYARRGRGWRGRNPRHQHDGRCRFRYGIRADGEIDTRSAKGRRIRVLQAGAWAPYRLSGLQSSDRGDMTRSGHVSACVRVRGYGDEEQYATWLAVDSAAEKPRADRDADRRQQECRGFRHGAAENQGAGCIHPRAREHAQVSS